MYPTLSEVGQVEDRALRPRDPADVSRDGQPEPLVKNDVYVGALRENTNMLGWALTFFIFALVAGYLGFFGLAGLAASIAKILLIVFVVLLIVSAFTGALRGRAPRV